jgi:hypothetical protein
MENGSCSAPTVLHGSIVKCFAVNRMVTSSSYMKGYVCVFVCVCVCVISTPEINVKFNCDQQY